VRRILDSIETVRLSRRLATIRCDVPLTITRIPYGTGAGSRTHSFRFAKNSDFVASSRISHELAAHVVLKKFR
jgi:hypothetical protein